MKTWSMSINQGLTVSQGQRTWMGGLVTWGGMLDIVTGVSLHHLFTIHLRGRNLNGSLYFLNSYTDDMYASLY